jgi:hypothetical protein
MMRLDAERAAELRRGFDAAAKAGDVAALRAFAQSESFAHVALADARDALRKLAESSACDVDFLRAVALRVEADRHVASLQNAILRAQVRSLEKRLGELEARPSAEYRGTWRPEVAYSPGALVTRSGSLWACIARASPDDVPGRSDTWQLAVKRGRAE